MTEDEAGGRNRLSIKWLVLGALVAILALFGVLNTHEVGVDWVVDTVEAPMITVILVSAALGFAMGFLVRGHLARGD